METFNIFEEKSGTFCKEEEFSEKISLNKEIINNVSFIDGIKKFSRWTEEEVLSY